MPGDTLRIAEPEETQNPYSFICHKETPNGLMVCGGNKRTDGRAPDQVRPLFLKAGVVSQAKGSAYVELNKTKVICAVYGPREVIKKEDFSMKGQLTCEFKFATFSCRARRQHQQDNEEKDLSVLLLESMQPAIRLDKFPKAQLNLYVTVLENDGSVLSAAIMCASVAVADAGIEMYDLVTACSARLYGDQILMDPAKSEEYDSKDCASSVSGGGHVTVGFMSSLNQMSALSSTGEVDLDTMTIAINRCTECCQQLYPVLQDCLVKTVKNSLQQN